MVRGLLYLCPKIWYYRRRLIMIICLYCLDRFHIRLRIFMSCPPGTLRGGAVFFFCINYVFIAVIYKKHLVFLYDFDIVKALTHQTAGICPAARTKKRSPASGRVGCRYYRSPRHKKDREHYAEEISIHHYDIGPVCQSSGFSGVNIESSGGCFSCNRGR